MRGQPNLPDDGTEWSDAPLTPADESPSSTAWVKIGAPLGAAALAVGTMAFVLLPGDDDSVKTIDADAAVTTTSTTTTTLPPVEAVFTDAPVVTEAVITTTTTTTTTTLPPTTTTEVLPSEPIAPPSDPRGYEEQIQIGGLSIPKIGLDSPMFEGIRLTTLDNGPGHWPGTAMPGEVGNVVVAAHRTSHNAEFRHIDQLVPGDIVNFTYNGEVIPYTVTGVQIVQPDAIWIVDPTPTATATLFACHPPGSVAQRIVVNLELSQ